MNRCVIMFVMALVFTTATASARDTRTVAAVNAPLAHMAQMLGGDAVEVVFPVPPDVDPAYWNPQPDDILRFQQSDLILLNGAGYAGWIENQVLPRARLVDTTAAIRDRFVPSGAAEAVHKHGPEGEHSHGGGVAITTWLDPDIATAQVDAVAEAMAARWPELAEEIAARKNALHDDIKEMDAALRSFFEDLSERQVLASHPVYQYLDRAYLGHMVSLHWEPDQAPPQSEWTALEAQLDTSASPLMIWEDAPLPETAQRLQDLGVEIVVLRPMGNADFTAPLFTALADQVR